MGRYYSHKGCLNCKAATIRRYLCDDCRRMGFAASCFVVILENIIRHLLQ